MPLELEVGRKQTLQLIFLQILFVIFLHHHRFHQISLWQSQVMKILLQELVLQF